MSRCLAIAHQAQADGHECTFLFNTNKYIDRISDTFAVYQSRVSLPKTFVISQLIKKARTRQRPRPIYTEISSLAYQVPRDGLWNETIVRQKLADYQGIIETVRPDVIVSDTNLLAGMVARRLNIPILQIVRYNFHPASARVIWWQEVPPDLIPPRVDALFNPILSEWGQPTIQQAEELLFGDHFVVPSLPEIEPIPADAATTHVGELTVNMQTQTPPDWLTDLDDDKPLIYVTIGGGAGPVGTHQFFQTVCDAFRNRPYQIVVSTSREFDASKLHDVPPNVRLFSWVPGILLIDRADVVIFHGGYGTTMETIRCGTPSIVVPFQSEQESNGRRLAQLGCGRVLALSHETPQLVQSNWRYGTFQYRVQTRYDLTPEQLQTEVMTVLDTPTYRQTVAELSQKIQQYDGARQTLSLIETLANR